MTSIVKISTKEHVIEQVKWKCKVYNSMFSTVIIVHFIFGLLTFYNGSANRWGGSSSLEIQESIYGLEFVFIVSIFMLFLLGWSLAAKPFLNQSYSIPNTNVQETVSSFILLILLALYTIVSALCTTVILFFIKILLDDKGIKLFQLGIDPSILFLFFIVILLASTVGYFLKSLYDVSKVGFIAVLGVFALLAIQVEDFFVFLFTTDVGTINMRSLFYLIILWGVTIICRKQNEVIRR